MTDQNVAAKRFTALIQTASSLLTGLIFSITTAACDHRCHPEAPHIFKRDGWYYLFLAKEELAGHMP